MTTKDLDIIINDLDTNTNNYCKEDLNMIKFIKMVNNKQILSPNIAPSKLHVSTRSAKCCLSHRIDMEKAAHIIKTIIENGESDTIVGLCYKDIRVGDVKKLKKCKDKTVNKKNNFYNQVTIIIKPFNDHKNVNIKFFLNGSISMTGCLNEDDGLNAINNFLSVIKNHPDVFYDKSHIGTISVAKYNITMINTDYILGFKIDRMNLYKLIVKNYSIYVSFDPTIYQGVKISYMWNKNNNLKDGLCKCAKQCRLEKNLRKKNVCKIVTIAIFQSGKIIITGASSIEQTDESYEFINKILYDNYSSIVRFSILDCE